MYPITSIIVVNYDRKTRSVFHNKLYIIIETTSVKIVKTAEPSIIIVVLVRIVS